MGRGLIHRIRSAAAVLLAGAAAIATASPAVAQDTASADAMAVLVEPLEFFRVQDLHFGQILTGTNTSFVVLSPDGNRTRASGNATLLGNDHQPARFAGMGVYNQLVRIRLGSSQIQLTGPGQNMRVDQFTIGSTPNTVVLNTNWQNFSLGDPTGMFNFAVGARLRVNPNQAPGSYTGTFTVTLDYM